MDENMSDELQDRVNKRLDDLNNRLDQNIEDLIQEHESNRSTNTQNFIDDVRGDTE